MWEVRAGNIWIPICLLGGLTIYSTSQPLEASFRRCVFWGDDVWKEKTILAYKGAKGQTLRDDANRAGVLNACPSNLVRGPFSTPPTALWSGVG